MTTKEKMQLLQKLGIVTAITIGVIFLVCIIGGLILDVIMLPITNTLVTDQVRSDNATAVDVVMMRVANATTILNTMIIIVLVIGMMMELRVARRFITNIKQKEKEE